MQQAPPVMSWCCMDPSMAHPGGHKYADVTRAA